MAWSGFRQGARQWPGGTLEVRDPRWLLSSPSRQTGTQHDQPEGAGRSRRSAGGRLGGITVLDPRNGEILVVAGVAFSGLQPPGLTFKIITAAGALENKIVKMTDEFLPRPTRRSVAYSW